MHTKKRPYEDTDRRQLSVNQEESPHQKPIMLACGYQTSGLQEYGKVNLCY